MMPPVTELINRDEQRMRFQRAKNGQLTKVIDKLTDDIRRSIEVNREFAIMAVGSDKDVHDLEWIKILDRSLAELGYRIVENGGYINEKVEL